MEPYFMIGLTHNASVGEVENYLKRRHEGVIKSIQATEKVDLDEPNHLAPNHNKIYLKLCFDTVQGLLTVRNALMPVVQRNRRVQASQPYNTADYHMSNNNHHRDSDLLSNQSTIISAAEYIIDIREYDIPYYIRVAIDLGFRVGNWYEVRFRGGVGITTTGALVSDGGIQAPSITEDNKEKKNDSDGDSKKLIKVAVGGGGRRMELEKRGDLVSRPEVKVLAYDIETTKQPLKFPDPSMDMVMMISYMVDRQGYLIVNRDIVSEDIADFEYTPRADLEGPFTVFNEPDEEGTTPKYI